MNNLNNIPGEIIKTSQLPEDMPTHLVGVILGTSPKTVKYSTTLFASQIASQMTDVVRTSFVYSDPTWLGTLHWNKIINTPSTILGYGITDAVSSSRTLSINGTTYDLSANRSWTVGDVLSSGSYVNPSWITSLAWTKITGAPAFITTAITSLNGLTGTTQTFVNDTNVTMVSTGTTHTLTWSGTLADARIESATNWNTAYTNRITSLTTTGSSGAATLVSNVLNVPTYTLAGLGGISLTGLSASSPLAYNNTTGAFSIQVANGSQNGYLSSADWTTFNSKQATISLTTTGSSGASTLAANVLNIPNYTLSGLGGQPLATNLTSISALTYASTSFVKMTASGTFALDTNTYLTAESDTLASVTGRGATTTTAITTGGLVVTGIITPSASLAQNVGSAALPFFNIFGNEFTAAAGSDFTLSSNTTAKNINFKLGVGGSGTIVGRFNLTTGNLTLQNGGTFTDAGFRLDVNGTARIQNQLTTTGSITAASAVARGVYMNNTLVASANNDVLVGLDVQPTFTLGAFTGVTTFGVYSRANMGTVPGTFINMGFGSTGGTSEKILFGGERSYMGFDTTIGGTIIGAISTRTVSIGLGTQGSMTTYARFHSTSGNLTLQNGGTFTDAGYRLDVNGTARIQGATTITPDAVTGTLATSSLDIAQTWNTTGTPIALKVNVTDTASGNLSDLMQLQIGGVTRFRVLKSGFFTHSAGGEIGGALVVGGATINSSAILEARSLTLGFLPPRMTTTQKNAIATPAAGLVVYDNTLNSLGVYNGTLWGPLITGVGTITASSALAQGVYLNNTLVAAANNDVLVGLDINPTFTLGAFTGTTSAALRVAGNILVSATATYDLGTSAVRFRNIYASGDISSSNNVLTANMWANTIKPLSGSNILFTDTSANAKGNFFMATGNLLLQNGGTLTDAGYRLDVNGTTRLNGLQTFQGTTASDTAPLGSELLTTGTGTNWTGTGFATGYTHTVGSTATLTSTLAAVVGNSYQITYTITGRTAGSISIDFGGTTKSNITATGATGPKATTTGTVVITPTSDFDGVLVLSIKVIGSSSATTTWLSSAGSIINEYRAHSDNSNLFFGFQAGRQNTTGVSLTAVGYRSLGANTTGIYNTAIGYNVLPNNTTGQENVAIGGSVLGNNTTGNNNIAIGGSTVLGSNTSGGLNIAIGGYSTLGSNVTGINNMAIGHVSLSASTGNANNAFGIQTLQNITTGNNNSALGPFAGRYAGSGTTALTSINNSLFIGYQTRALNATGDTNEIVIGYDTVGLGSNTTIIGNSSTVTTALYGNLLLGTTTATGAGLTVSNAITASSAIARGVYFNQTLTAAANNDVLIGLDIAPTFTNGAFTGVVNYGIRNSSKTTLGDILSITGGGSTPVGLGNGLHLNFSSNIGWIQSLQTGVLGRQLNIMGNPIFMGNSNSGVLFFNLTTSGNLILQNGGTFTDAGFRLDVVGADSRFNGIRAGLGAGQVASNTVFGNGALGSNSTGTGVTAIGFEALKVSTGNNNTAFGYRVGVGITTGVNNTGVGHFALTNNGSNNTAVGMYAYTYGTGNSNTAIGLQSLYNTGSSNSNTAIGYQTLTSNTGNLNTAVGYQSGNANTSGANNTLLGSNTVTGNFSGCLILGKDATATANNQFVVGSSTVNAGAVATASVTQTKTWDVIINGVAQKILLA